MRDLLTRRKWLIASVATLTLAGVVTYGLIGREASPPAPEASQAEAVASEDGAHAQEEGLIELSADQIEAARIELVSLQAGGGTETLLAGRVEPMIDARAPVAAAVSGRISRVWVAPGQRVRAGQALITILSGEGAAFRAEIDASQASVALARQSFERTRSLSEQGIVAKQELETSRAELLNAEATGRAARARASAAGSPDARGNLNITSPIDGVVSSLAVGPGGFAAQGAIVAEITNPERVELVFNAPPQVAALAKAGNRLKVRGPEGEFEAQIVGVAALSANNGGAASVIRARPLSGTRLASGSAVTGSLMTEPSNDPKVTVPSEAIQTVNGTPSVFVRVEGGFKATPVLTGHVGAGRTEILKGLIGSEQIVGNNAFLLKAELAKGEASHSH